MPQNRKEKFLFALLTVVITVHLFVFYNLSYVSGLTLSQLRESGVPLLGRASPIWAVVLAEFVCALLLELFVGSPASTRLALRAVDPRANPPFLVETAIISATVCIMCPAMSLLAVLLYRDLSSLSPAGFLAAWLHTIFHNFPLALFGQLFFIQPLVRRLFTLLSRLWRSPAPRS